MYALETADTRKFRAAFLPLGEYRSRTDAIFWAKELTAALGRPVRVVKYQPEFEIIWDGGNNGT